MKPALAKQVLTQIMQWSPDEASKHVRLLSSLASYKWDDYGQFRPGHRSLESLARWLRQFASQEERNAAIEFLSNKLIFISRQEMQHLVEMAWPFVIRPWLVKVTLDKESLGYYDLARAVSSSCFNERLNRTAFLGLSDGAMIDHFRRSNSEVINHEQVHGSYRISDELAKGMLKKLRTRTANADAKFESLVLIDDFNGSGCSCIRNKDDNWEGKVKKIVMALEDKERGLGEIIDSGSINILIVHYISTSSASSYVREGLDQAGVKELIPKNIHIEHQYVYELSDQFAITEKDNPRFWSMLMSDSYYSHSSIYDEHFQIGELLGTRRDARLGFASCSLPLVLHHNTPNNSVFLLWVNTEDHNFHGIFPRIPRHKSGREQ